MVKIALRNKLVYVGSFLLMFGALGANAAHHCLGKVNTVDVQGNGRINVNIEGIGDGNMVCSLTAEKIVDIRMLPK